MIVSWTGAPIPSFIHTYYRQNRSLPVRFFVWSLLGKVVGNDWCFVLWVHDNLLSLLKFAGIIYPACWLKKRM